MEPEEGHEGHGAEPMVMKHISDASGCRNFGEIKKGDELYAVSVYNATLHPQVSVRGRAERIFDTNHGIDDARRRIAPSDGDCIGLHRTR